MLEYLRHIEFKKIKNEFLPNPISSSDSGSDSFFFSSFLSPPLPPPPAAAAAGASAAATPAAAGAAPALAPTFVIKSLIDTPSNALANKPGQYGSISTLAAFKIVWIFSPWKYSQIHNVIQNVVLQVPHGQLLLTVTPTSSSAKIRAA